MAIDSRHNKYVSIPDWFSQSNSPIDTKETTGTVTATGAAAISFGGSGSGMTDVVLHNKFVLTEFELDASVLIITNTALVVNGEGNELGDLVTVEGWAVSDYHKVAAGTQLIVNSTIHEQYGLVFYDETFRIIKGELITAENHTITVPDNAYYYRISSELNFENFSIKGFSTQSYEYDQINISDQNVTNFLELNAAIPEGVNTVSFRGSSLHLLVQNPLSLRKDSNDVVKLSLDYSKLVNDVDDMFVWDKTLSAYGYDTVTKKAYQYIDGEQQFTTDEEGNEIPVMTDNSSMWMYDTEATDKWVIKATKPRVSLFGGLFEYDTLLDCFFFHKSIITSGGVVMYADDKTVDVPTIYEGLPVDGQTIYWETVTNPDGTTYKRLKAEGKGGTLVTAAVTGTGNVLTDVSITDDGTTLLFNRADNFVTLNNFNTLQKRIDDFFSVEEDVEETINKWAELEKFLNGFKDTDELAKILQTKADVNWVNENFLSLNGGTMRGSILVDASDSYVLGGETNRWLNMHSKEVTIAGIPILSKLNDVLYIDGNLAVRGGITMYAYDSVDIKSWMEEIATDGKTIINDGGVLKLNPNLDLSEQVDDLRNDINVELNSIRNTLSTKWTQNDTLINNWNAAYGWGDHSKAGYATKEWADDTFVHITGDNMEGNLGTWSIYPITNNFYQCGTPSRKWSETYAITTYSDELYIEDINIYQSKSNVLFIDANLVVSGGITMYGWDSSYTPDLSEFLNNAGYSTKGIASFDPTYFGVSNGHVTLTGDLGVSHWNELEGKPSYIGTSSLNYSLTIKDSGGTSQVVYNGSADKTLTLTKAMVGLSNVSNSTYAGGTAVTLNGSSKASSTASFYAPTSGGTSGYILKSNGSGAPSWVNQNTLSVGSATNAENVYVNTSSVNAVYPVVFALNATAGNKSLYTDTATGAGYNPSLNRFSARDFLATRNVYVGDTSYGIGALNGQLTMATYSTFDFMQDGTSVVFMDASAKFGLGTTKPSFKLHVIGDIGNEYIRLRYSTRNPYLALYRETTDEQWYVLAINGYLALGESSTSACKVDAVGNVIVEGNLLVKGGITMYANATYSMSSSGTGATIDADGNLSITGVLTQSSDIRRKTTLGDVLLSLDLIANAPLVKYYYNLDTKRTTHVGSIAQYWADINDWFCKTDNDGYYTMEIQNLALASAISVARELLRFESATDREIRELKEKVAILENELNEYKNK